MDWRNWQEEERNLSDRIDSAATERNIYIIASRTSTPDDQTLRRTRFQFYFNIIHRTCSDTNPTREARILCYLEDYCYTFDRFASAEEAKALVTSMFNDHRVVFDFDRERGQGLHWKELPTDDSSAVLDREPAMLQCFDDVVTRISEFATRIAGEASASGCKFVEIVFTIDKRTVVPHQEFDQLIPRDMELFEIWDHNNPDLYLQIDEYCIVHFSGLRWLAERSRWLRQWVENVYAGMDHDQGVLNHDETELNDVRQELLTAMGESFSELMIRSVPTAKSAVEALERFRYERSGDVDEDESKFMNCVICKEDVIIGSCITRMPCSHVYHSDCISQWLRRNHTCPICRFELPTSPVYE